MVELTQIMSYDLNFNLLVSPHLWNLSAGWQNLIHTLLSLLIGLVMTLLFRPWIFRHEKSRFSWGQMSLVLLPFLVYAYARNLQFILQETTTALSHPFFRLRIGLLLLLLGFSDLMVAILTDLYVLVIFELMEMLFIDVILLNQRV